MSGETGTLESDVFIVGGTSDSMGKLGDLSMETLQEALDASEDSKAAKRLMIALAYKDGVSVETLTHRYGLSRSTVYSWLDRFENRTVEAAIYDDDRPGRPSKLDTEERSALSADVFRSPTELGFEQSTWTPELLAQHIEQEYGVAYSLGHVRRILREHDVG